MKKTVKKAVKKTIISRDSKGKRVPAASFCDRDTTDGSMETVQKLFDELQVLHVFRSLESMCGVSDDFRERLGGRAFVLADGRSLVCSPWSF